MFALLRSGFAAPAPQTFDFIESFFDTLTKKVTRLALRIEWRVDFHAAVKPPMIATRGRYRFSKLAFCFDAS